MSDSSTWEDQLGDAGALSQGDRASKTAEDTIKEKKNERDFVLWKKSKPDEPVWPSPWDPGRPGLHFGCIVVARTILGKK